MVTPFTPSLGSSSSAIAPFVEHGGSDVDCDAPYVDVLGPVYIQYLVFRSEAFALSRICTSKYVGISWGFIQGLVVEICISSVENIRCL